MSSHLDAVSFTFSGLAAQPCLFFSMLRCKRQHGTCLSLKQHECMSNIDRICVYMVVIDRIYVHVGHRPNMCTCRSLTEYVHMLDRVIDLLTGCTQILWKRLQGCHISANYPTHRLSHEWIQSRCRQA